mgnify:CR=1 FL=1
MSVTPKRSRRTMPRQLGLRAVPANGVGLVYCVCRVCSFRQDGRWVSARTERRHAADRRSADRSEPGHYDDHYNDHFNEQTVSPVAAGDETKQRPDDAIPAVPDASDGDSQSSSSSRYSVMAHTRYAHAHIDPPTPPNSTCISVDDSDLEDGDDVSDSSGAPPMGKPTKASASRPQIPIDDEASTGSDSSPSASTSDSSTPSNMPSAATSGQTEYVFTASEASSLNDADSPLHEGTNLTVLTTCYLLIMFMTDNNVPKSGMQQLWHYLVLMLGEDASSNLPSFAQAYKWVTGYGGASRSELHCCVNDCVVFRDRPIAHDPTRSHRYAKLDRCPLCDEPRFNSSGKPRRVCSWIGVNRQLAARLWSPGECQTCHFNVIVMSL